jgi:hydrogenase/urease accessory protein HupE
MEDFALYFRLGVDHILSWDAMDHILFVTALCLRYLWKDWKKVIILVTAFTIGHSVTLALSAMNIIDLPSDWVEFVIPLTIAATCINNIFQRKPVQSSRLPLIYFFALFFGLIHGLAFAGLYKDLQGREGLLTGLFAFNVGIELAQLAVVVIVLALGWLVVQLLKLPRLWWLRAISVVILVFSLFWAYERFPYNKNYTNEKALVFGCSRLWTV